MNRIKELRKEKGLAQQELAEKIGVHYRTIQRWENEHKIALDQAQLLADYFDVSVAYLLGYSDTTKDNKDFITISVKEYNELKNRSDALDGIIETLKDKKCESYF
ncbi:TPA: helix-turn-helix domain-containing protein [Streptococcus pyogenes]